MDAVWNNLVEILGSWSKGMMENLPQMFGGVLIFVLSIYLARGASKLLLRTLKARETDREISILLERLVRWAVISIGLVLALQQAGQDVSALLAGIGIFGFAIGFALQDVMANFVAGLLILIQQPFDIGDYIEVAGYDGTVLTVELRTTEMLTGDGRRVTIPNNDIFSNAIINYTRTEKRRITMALGVDYDSDLEKVRQVSIEAIKTIPGVLTDPGPSVVFGSFGDTAINLNIYYWFSTKETGSNSAKDGGILAIKKAYDEAEITMPFPTQTLIIQK